MQEFIHEYEPIARLTAFIGVFALMLVLETLLPFKNRRLKRFKRWPSNLSIIALDTILVRFLIPAGAVGAALWTSSQPYGVLPFLTSSLTVQIVLGVLVLDLAIYWQHRLFHRIPWCWRFHRMHHLDQDFDVTTGFRFHPVEMILSMGVKIALVIALGVPAEAVILFEIILSATSLFNHANIELPTRIEPWVRSIIVTPGMHRIHHSQRVLETNSNYGFNLSCWDRLFRSYTKHSKDGTRNIQIGIREFQAAQQTNGLWGMLLSPWQAPQSLKAEPDTSDGSDPTQQRKH